VASVSYCSLRSKRERERGSRNYYTSLLQKSLIKETLFCRRHRYTPCGICVVLFAEVPIVITVGRERRIERFSIELNAFCNTVYISEDREEHVLCGTASSLLWEERGGERQRECARERERERKRERGREMCSNELDAFCT